MHSTLNALFSTWVVSLIVTSLGTKRQRRMNHVHFHTFQSQFNTFNYIIDDYSSWSMCTPDSDNFIYPYWEVVWVTVLLCSREKDGLAAVCSVLWYTVGYLYIWHRVMKKSASANYTSYVLVIVLQELTSSAGFALFIGCRANGCTVEIRLNFAIILSEGQQTSHFTRTRLWGAS